MAPGRPSTRMPRLCFETDCANRERAALGPVVRDARIPRAHPVLPGSAEQAPGAAPGVRAGVAISAADKSRYAAAVAPRAGAWIGTHARSSSVTN